MDFKLRSHISNIETVAVGGKLRELRRLRRKEAQPSGSIFVVEIPC